MREITRIAQLLSLRCEKTCGTTARSVPQLYKALFWDSYVIVCSLVKRRKLPTLALWKVHRFSHYIRGLELPQCTPTPVGTVIARPSDSNTRSCELSQSTHSPYLKGSRLSFGLLASAETSSDILAVDHRSPKVGMPSTYTPMTEPPSPQSCQQLSQPITIHGITKEYRSFVLRY